MRIRMDRGETRAGGFLFRPGGVRAVAGWNGQPGTASTGPPNRPSPPRGVGTPTPSILELASALEPGFSKRGSEKFLGNFFGEK